MSADLFIHLFEGITERDIAIMEKNTFGSKYFNPGKLGDEWDRAIEKIGKTEQIKVGEGDGAGREAVFVMEAPHLGHRDPRHRRRRRDRRAADRPEPAAGNDGRHRQSAATVPEEGVGQPVQFP